MNHTFYFLGGLPRAGSTLLCNVLAQNPRFHATHTSGCMDVMFGVRNQWNNLIEHKAHPDEEAQQRVLRAILEAYYEPVEKPVIIDKCRGWVSLLEMAEWAIGEKAKVIVPVRDLRDVLASFEKLWRGQAKKDQMDQEGENYFLMQTVEGRCEHWTTANQPVGLAYNRIRDALTRGFQDRMHFVHYEKLCRTPEKTMRSLYDFLGENYYSHDFENVEQVTWEDDTVHAFGDLHTIRPKIQPQEKQYPKILKEAANRYARESFWADL